MVSRTVSYDRDGSATTSAVWESNLTSKDLTPEGKSVSTQKWSTGVEAGIGYCICEDPELCGGEGQWLGDKRFRTYHRASSRLAPRHRSNRHSS